MSDPILVLERVTRSDRGRGFGPVDLAIHPGQLALVMGPSGSGKTTLLSLLGLLLRPSSGRVFLGGRLVPAQDEVAQAELRRGNVAFVFQQFNLIESLTASENVQVALALRGVIGRRARNEADALLERVGLRDSRDQLPGGLSGGQKQRVGIARALASPGRVVLADEPTAALDTANGEAMMRLLRDLARTDGRAVVAVTHDPRWREYAARIFELEDGRITREEAPRHVRVHLQTALPGRADRRGDARDLRTGYRREVGLGR